MAFEPFSKPYFTNPCHQYLYVYPITVAKQGLGKNVSSKRDFHAAIEIILNASFSKRSLL
jgi:hypothetical protein